MVIKGKIVDGQTRCVHYHGSTDIIAIRFKCCNEYYPCYECHLEEADHAALVWDKDEFDTKAILCGSCKNEMSITTYKNCNFSCPFCDAAFNPRCENHYHLYFEV